MIFHIDMKQRTRPLLFQNAECRQYAATNEARDDMSMHPCTIHPSRELTGKNVSHKLNNGRQTIKIFTNKHKLG